MPHAIFDDMRDWRDALEDRTQAFADAAIDASLRLAALPGLRQAADQLNAAATSVGANHRAMRRARSDREFAAKLQIVLEEADEAVYWLELASPRTGQALDELRNNSELPLPFTHSPSRSPIHPFAHSHIYSLTRPLSHSHIARLSLRRVSELEQQPG